MFTGVGEMSSMESLENVEVFETYNHKFEKCMYARMLSLN